MLKGDLVALASVVLKSPPNKDMKMPANEMKDFHPEKKGASSDDNTPPIRGEQGRNPTSGKQRRLL